MLSSGLSNSGNCDTYCVAKCLCEKRVEWRKTHCDRVVIRKRDLYITILIQQTISAVSLLLWAPYFVVEDVTRIPRALESLLAACCSPNLQVFQPEHHSR